MSSRIERDATPPGAGSRSVYETEPLKPMRPARKQDSASVRPKEVPPSEAQASFNFHPVLDDLPEESPLTVEVNGRPVASFLCTPQATRELAVGWAFAQGFVDNAAAIRHVSETSDRVTLMVDDATEGGRSWAALVAAGFDGSLLRATSERRPFQLAGERDAQIAADWSTSRERFLATVARIFERFRLERGSGGFHHAGAGDGESVCILARDVSRHNAIDKIVGWTLLHRVDRSRLTLCLTGRITADIAYKAWRGGFPALAASGLPTADAVEVAEAGGIAIIGQALDVRRTVYCHGWRLTLDDD